MLQNKTAIITGASRGIGRQIALTFAENGANLVLNGNDQEKLAEVKFLAQKKGVKAEIVIGDIASPDTAKELVKTALEHFHTVDVLVNNAGTMLRAPFLEVNHQDWQRVMEINFTGAFYTCQSVLPVMIEQKQGCIINISSVAGKTAHANSAPCYGASKAALHSLTQKLAYDMGKYNIRVNSIAPGPIATEMSDQWTPEYRQSVLNKIPLQRMGTPKNIADVALFLASPMADFITGESINVNGGTYMN
jgi:3-oxoacyl-[acyl-carrier protein] reductase